MRRITVEEVLEAYRVTGIVPRTRTYHDIVFKGDVLVACGCPIGVLAVAAGVDPGDNSFRQWGNEQFGHYYRCGVEYGFDGDKISDGACKTPEDQAEYELGYADGTAVRKAVFQEQGA